MGIHGSLSNFNQGQVISAAGHLNTLQQYITLVHDDVAGVSVPGQASATCYVRHTWNTLAYSLVRNSGTITIKYDNTTVATFASGTTLTGTIDLTSYGFAVNQFYAVTVTGSATIYYLREQNTASYPTLAAFTNGSIPTAAQWQALNTYAAALSDNLDVPLPLNTRLYGEANFNLYYPMVHRGRNLVFGFRATAPYQCGGGGHTRVELWSAGGNLFDQSYGASTSVETVLDLSTLYPALAIGQNYRLNLIVSQSSGCEFEGYFYLFKLYEYPSASDAAPSWTAFAKWVHGDNIWGNSNGGGGQVKMTTIKSNLQALGGIVTGLNYMTPQRADAGANAFLYGIRRRRFLHYKTYTDQSCTVNWMFQGEAQQTTLPESASSFMAADLDSLEGLTVGTHYWIGGTEYALEDSHV